MQPLAPPECNVKDDISEVFGGEPVRSTSDHTVRCADQILQAAFYKDPKKGIRAVLEKTAATKKKSFAVATIVDKCGNDLVKKLIACELGSPSPLNEKAKDLKSFDDIWDPCIYLHKVGQHVLQLTHYGFPECRLLLDGDELIIALSYAAVPGTGFAQKMAAVSDMRVDRFIDFACKHGFIARMKAKGDLLIIPAGFLVCTITGTGNCDAAVLRWSFSTPASRQGSAEEMYIIKGITDNLLQAYPSLAAGTHGKIREMLAN